jgi:hypothetical protein
LKVINKEFKTEDVRNAATTLLGGTTGLEASLSKIIADGDFDINEIYTELVKDQAANFATLSAGALGKIENISSGIKDLLSKKLAEIKAGAESSTKTSVTSVPTTSDATSYGNISVLGQTGVNPNFSRGSVPVASREPIKIDQDVTVDFINPPANLTPAQINEIIDQTIRKVKMTLNEQSFKNFMADPSKVYE